MRVPYLVTILIATSTSFSAALQASENSYYAADLDAAVKEAKRNPADSKYVGNRWYNRSTSKSFDFPKLLNQEMQTEVVDGALDATASGPGDVAPERTSPLELSETEAKVSEKDELELELLPRANLEETALSLQPEANILELGSKIYEVKRIEYNSAGFSGSATDIRSEATSRAYQTPEN